MFHGLPVREGRGDILVQPSKNDIRQARPRDPANCAYAICLKRMLETSRVFVYTTVCYIETLDERGNRIMERYEVRNHAHAWVQKFDAGQEVSPGGFILHKPIPTKTLDYKRTQSRKWYRANPDKVKKITQASYERYKEKRKNPTAKQYTGSFRNGTGMVKFYGTYEGMLMTHHENEST
jgi:hypothetical protein